MTAKLDETALRRQEFQPGEPVVLADGQPWQLRRPVLAFVPAETEAGFAVCLDLDGDDGFGDLVTAYDAADGGPALLRAELALGRAVLIAQYDLSAAQVARLLRFGYGDNPDGSRIRDEVLAVATGRGKGQSDAGDG